MIEIIVIVLLCITNFKNAKARGKSGGAAIAYTLGLWIGAEILGAVIGFAVSGGDESPIVYIIALIFAAGGGVGSYFIAKSGTVVQNQVPLYPGPAPQQNTVYPNQQPQPPYPGQPAQNLPPNPGQQPQPVYGEGQGQPLPPQPVQQAAPPVQAAPVAGQGETATIVFTAKKVMGQFLVSSVTIEVNGVPYQAGFNEPINILAPAGNVQIDCYLNYMGKSGAAQTLVALAPNQTYQLEYKSPAVVAAAGTLNITQA